MKKNKYLNKIRKRTPDYVKEMTKESERIAEKIDELRIKKGWTKSELAKKMSKKPSEITKFLSGQHNFTLLTLAKLKQVLDYNFVNKEADVNIIVLKSISANVEMNHSESCDEVFEESLDNIGNIPIPDISNEYWATTSWNMTQTKC